MGKNTEIEVDLVIGADGANSRVAKEIGAGEYDYAIAFQVCTAERHTMTAHSSPWEPATRKIISAVH